ncbi:hypothetical protein FS837_003360 [Tulasnella sp. UAMH 9824]|nr:hypothetical protein FS837_003360 [Tulasnella sp. UAMH 9824]
MQINRQANSSARAKVFVNKTRDFFSAFTNSFKYPEIRSLPVTPPTFEKQASALTSYEVDPDAELSYPAPRFARRRTSSSLLSGSTNSTSTPRSSIFSHHTDQTAITVAGEDNFSYIDKKAAFTGAEESKPTWHDSAVLGDPDEPSRGSCELQIESSADEDHGELSSEEEEEDDEGMLFIHSKRGARFQPGFATSLTRNPYGAFLSQPLYKPSYIFPAPRRSMNLYDA